MDQACLNAIRRYYPEARTTDETVCRLLDLLQSHLGLSPKQIMSADSICSDDLNTIEYPKQAYEMLGPFKMGGLNGFPFTGLTGMGAFAHHVPEDGAVFVFYGPHVGVTASGKLGEVLRPGQTVASSCCGALRAALNRLMKGDIVSGSLTDLDYQQNTIEQILLEAKDRILGAADPIWEATEVMFEAIRARIEILAGRTSYPCRHLVLMGGILINADHGAGSYACLRQLDIVDLKDGQREDLLGKIFA